MSKEDNKNKTMRPNILQFSPNTSGTGIQIKADIGFNPNCVEFVMKKGFQTIMQGASSEVNAVISFEPWIQFPDKQWTEMLENTFKEMIELWNAKYSVKQDSE